MFRVLQDQPDEDTLPAAVQARHEVEDEQRRLATIGDKRIRQYAPPRRRCPRRRPSVRSGMSALSSAPNCQAPMNSDSVAPNRAARSTRLQVSNSSARRCSCAARFQFCRRVGGAAADEAGFAFADEGGEFGNGIVRAAVAKLPCSPSLASSRPASSLHLAGTVGGKAFQEGRVLEARDRNACSSISASRTSAGSPGALASISMRAAVGSLRRISASAMRRAAG